MKHNIRFLILSLILTSKHEIDFMNSIGEYLYIVFLNSIQVCSLTNIAFAQDVADNDDDDVVFECNFDQMGVLLANQCGGTQHVSDNGAGVAVASFELITITTTFQSATITDVLSISWLLTIWIV